MRPLPPFRVRPLHRPVVRRAPDPLMRAAILEAIAPVRGLKINDARPELKVLGTATETRLKVIGRAAARHH